ncbi:TIGR04255 family protein [Amnibacterium endophyticum]|uniref:TIGR04255 family protein n=1 Tax=Amnibacterium endophyticum TaxID=2109337 RepID=A0ABW4LET8_9MICO
MTEWYNRDAQPQFERPPVAEAALSLEYPPVPSLGSYQLSRLQAKWEQDYSHIQDVPAVPPSQLVQLQLEPSFQFQLNASQPVRIWAVNPSNGMLIQTQADRLVLNWRDEGVGRKYPGYDALRTEYVRLWGLLVEFLTEFNLPVPAPVFGEYTYVNFVPLEPSDTMADVVSIVRAPAPERALPGRELLTRFQFVRDIEKSDEHPMAAQVVVTGEPQGGGDARRVLLNVDTRAIFDGTQTDVFEGLDVAHALSSFTFDRIIADKKREAWGQESGSAK